MASKKTGYKEVREAMARNRGGPGPGAYQLPPTVGYKGHDQTRYQNPAYKLGMPLNEIRKANTPGPQYVLGRSTRYGKNSEPQYSLGTKPRALQPFNVPGPGTYAPEKVKDSGPAYSIGKRTARMMKSESPGPNAYKLPGLLGPAIAEKWAAPAYSMGRNHQLGPGTKTPGPAAYDPPKLTAYKQNDPGKSLGIRLGGTLGGRPGPGPAQYLPDYKPALKRPPAFSFGTRHTEFKTACVTEKDNPEAFASRCEPKFECVAKH